MGRKGMRQYPRTQVIFIQKCSVCEAIKIHMYRLERLLVHMKWPQDWIPNTHIKCWSSSTFCRSDDGRIPGRHCLAHLNQQNWWTPNSVRDSVSIKMSCCYLCYWWCEWREPDLTALSTLGKHQGLLCYWGLVWCPMGHLVDSEFRRDIWLTWLWTIIYPDYCAFWHPLITCARLQ